MGENLRYDVSQVTFDQTTRRLSLIWGDGHESVYPFIWLRHARMFPLMGRPEQQDQREYLDPENPAGMSIAATRIDAGDLIIDWLQDSTPTRHPLEFLRNHCLSGTARRERHPRPQHWDAASAKKFKWFDGKELKNPQQRLKVFESLRNLGIALLNNLPTEPETLRAVAANFGPTRNTHFGDLFDIRSLPDDQLGTGQDIGATSCNAQSPHTDEGWRHSPPGISLMHCLHADPSGGGASIYVDGIAAAESLRESEPEAFEFLASVPLNFAAERNPEERFRSRARVIAVDDDGVVRGIRITDRTLLQPDLPVEQVEPAYRAIGKFYRILLSGQYSLERLLQPGEVVAFDNHRVLHARRAFNPQAGERWIQQLSIDREEFQNIFRQLAESQSRFDISHWEQDAGALSQGSILT